MRDLILTHDAAIRLAFFIAILAVMVLWEVAAPRRPAPLRRWARWPSNLGIGALNTLLVRLLLPTTAVALAMVAEANGWGLLHQLALPAWVALPLAVIALDLAVYLQHLMVHAVPVLWPLHRVHHADLHFDVVPDGRRRGLRQGRPEGPAGLLQPRADGGDGRAQGRGAAVRHLMDARGLADAEIVEGARRSTMDELADPTLAADRILVF